MGRDAAGRGGPVLRVVLDLTEDDGHDWVIAHTAAGDALDAWVRAKAEAGLKVSVHPDTFR